MRHSVEFKESYKYDDMEYAHIFFKNGYGASIVKGKGISLGCSSVLDLKVNGDIKRPYELFILKKGGPDEKQWEICYESGIAGDSVGHLTLDMVMGILDQIESLPDGEYK